MSVSIAGSGVRLSRDVDHADREALADVVTDLAAAAADHDLGVVVAIDEAQLLDPHDLRRILAGVHRAGQDGLPLWCVLAGLPNLVGIMSHAATYAERLFTVAELGPLPPDQAAEAITLPAEEIGVTWAPEAVDAIIDESEGYPFFVQVWAYHTWNAAQDEPISLADVERAAPAARPRPRQLVLRRPHRPHPRVRGGLRAGARLPRTRTPPLGRGRRGVRPLHPVGRRLP